MLREGARSELTRARPTSQLPAPHSASKLGCVCQSHAPLTPEEGRWRQDGS